MALGHPPVSLHHTRRLAVFLRSLPHRPAVLAGVGFSGGTAGTSPGNGPVPAFNPPSKVLASIFASYCQFLFLSRHSNTASSAFLAFFGHFCTRAFSGRDALPAGEMRPTSCNGLCRPRGFLDSWHILSRYFLFDLYHIRVFDYLGGIRLGSL